MPGLFLVRNGAPLGVLCSGAAPILGRSFSDPLAKPMEAGWISLWETIIKTRHAIACHTGEGIVKKCLAPV
jgi:hypothetical protein